MCGICGFIGFENSFKYAYRGILKLLNRGYDSVGVTTINKNSSFITHKYASDDNELADSKILKHQYEHDGSISIFHSRWRTTGGKTDVNSHPHNDTKGKFSLVHNGIIENYTEIKKFLIENGFEFKSETDTEAIVNLISYFYHKSAADDPVTAISMALSKIEGTYALAILCIDRPNELYCVRHGSPLLIGFAHDNSFAMISSECHGFDKKICRYIVADSNDIISLKKENGEITMKSFDNIIYQNRKIDLSNTDHCGPCGIKDVNNK
jgi:glucosamine--fructose-6-phosphate aminotransferase (isomerizing)